MKKIIITLTTLLLILTACTGGGTSTDFNPHQGEKGMIIEFLKDAPPDEVYENTLLTIGLQIQNKGAENIEKGKIVVTTERRLFEDFDNAFNLDLEGKSQLDPKGEKILKIIETETKKILASEKQKTNLKINFCYPYKTVLSTAVCIDPDVLGQKEDKPSICPSKSISFWGGQGAPVVVSKITPTMVPREEGIVPVFQFEIKNIGDGKVVKKSSYEKACSSQGLTKDEIGQIDASTIYLGHDQLTCTKTQLTIEQVQEGNEFYDTQKTFMRCEGSLIPYEQEAYIGSLTMTLEYGYRDSVEIDFFILKTPASLN